MTIASIYLSWDFQKIGKKFFNIELHIKKQKN